MDGVALCTLALTFGRKIYRVSTLQYVGGDSRKSSHPHLSSKNWSGGPYGPWHGSFVRVRSEAWVIFHAKDESEGGWDGRKSRVQRMIWTPNGPHMDGSVSEMVPNEQSFMVTSTGASRACSLTVE